MEDLSSFFKKFNIKTKNIELYELAFTHASFNSDAKTTHHDYERLEFLGDSVLDFVIATKLYLIHPELREGDLTKAKALLVQSKSLASLARKEDFVKFIRIGHSLSIKEVEENNSILEDIFEAVIGAIYLDKGIDFVTKFIFRIFKDELYNIDMEELKDYKSMLQEAMQAEYRESVQYRVVDEKGPPHFKTFYVEVSFNDIILGRGSGKSKKEAEQNAAKDALAKKATL